MVLNAGVDRCENVEELQAIIHALLVATHAIFQRKRGDPGAIEDFMRGQTAILSALVFLNIASSVSEYSLTELIQEIWRRYKLGPTLGNGQACHHLLYFLHQQFGDDSRLDWQWWKPLDWTRSPSDHQIH
jgi:hypothetical protein